jgi:hypothetical protein
LGNAHDGFLLYIALYHMSEGQFTCPECGSHEFGSFKGEGILLSDPPEGAPGILLPDPPVSSGLWTRACHGYKGEGFQRKPCTFQWSEVDDEKYGITKETIGIGTASTIPAPDDEKPETD